MSDGMNLVILAGNVGADPDLRATQGGTSVLNIRLATNKSWVKDGERQERTDWHSVVVWGPRAEGLSKILTKGISVVIRGELRTSSYDDKNGEKRYRTEVVADEVILSGGRGDGARAPAESGGQRRGATARKNTSRGPAKPQQTGGDYGSPDDIPY